MHVEHVITPCLYCSQDLPIFQFSLNFLAFLNAGSDEEGDIVGVSGVELRIVLSCSFSMRKKLW